MSRSERARDTLPLRLMDRVDRACDAFEAAWRSGRQPRLEEFRASGERPTLEEYARRFLGEETRIVEAWHGSTAAAAGRADLETRVAALGPEAATSVDGAPGTIVAGPAAVAVWDGVPSPGAVQIYLQASALAQISDLAGPVPEGRSASDRAMRLLHRAVAEGYREIFSYAGDSTLDPLRQRPDFQLLLMDLQFPADSFARPD